MTKLVGEMIKPVLNRVLVEIVAESSELIPGSGIVRAGKTKFDPEPWCIVHAVGKDVVTMKPGDYVVTVPHVQFLMMEFNGKNYALINEYEVTGVIDKELADMLSKAKLNSSHSGIAAPLMSKDIN